MTAGQPEKDALRVLKRLSVRGGRLFAGDGNRYRLTRGGRRGARGQQEVSAEVVESLGARGLIAPAADGGWVLTASGRMFVRRGLATATESPHQQQQPGPVTLNDDALGTITVTVNHNESPLSWLRRRKGSDGRPMIDGAEFEAGERLRSDYTRAQLLPRITANWTAAVAGRRRNGGAGGIAELTEAALAARKRVAQALAAVGPELGGVLVDFCCFLKGLEQVEQERRWPARSAKVVVEMALRELARHYGLLARARGPERSGKIRGWGTDDFRPT